MKLTKSVLITLNIACLTATLTAEEVTPRKRLHSVKEVMGQVSKMQDKNVSMVDNFKHMFKDAKVSGQFKTMYAGYKQKESGVANDYATAIGGILKYELAKLNGFNAGVAVYTSHDIPLASGANEAHNSELSSLKGKYTTIGEAYINYMHENFNFRAGRQQLDTPLADSDDIRMVQNSFEAYVASYELSGFHLMAGRINNWQGYDADLDEGWSATGKNGTNFAGVSYNDIYELNAWFYNITGQTNASYFDTGINYPLTKKVNLHAMVQLLKEDELSSSGYDADVYGGMLEFVFGGLGVNFAYNSCDASHGNKFFLGTGGGSLFTSMDTMTIDVIAADRKAQAIVSGISYNYDNFNLLYAYGDFFGDKDSLNIKAHIREQDIGFEYNVNDEFILSGVYVIEEDRQSSVKTDNDWNRAQLMLHYNF